MFVFIISRIHIHVYVEVVICRGGGGGDGSQYASTALESSAMNQARVGGGISLHLHR